MYNTVVLVFTEKHQATNLPSAQKGEHVRWQASAFKYLSISVKSVNAERSFSAYNNLVYDKRHNLTQRNTKMLRQY